MLKMSFQFFFLIIPTNHKPLQKQQLFHNVGWCGGFFKQKFKKMVTLPSNTKDPAWILESSGP